MNYKVALCGLTARDERLIEIVIARAPNPKYRFAVGKAIDVGIAHIAIVDANSLAGVEALLTELRALNPQLVTVVISDLGQSGDTRYRIERRSLLLHVCRVLDSVVEAELAQAGTATAPTAAAPRRADVAIAEPAPQAAVSSAPLQPLRALVVDDSVAVREQLKAALERSGIQSDPAEHAEEATVRLRTGSYDLVFLDVVMPGTDGYEVCRNIKKNTYTRALPVIMLTSRSSPFDRARGALAGCDTYLVKPITWEAFFSAVDKILLKQFRSDRSLLAARGYRSAAAG